MTLSLVLRGGDVYDGSGGPPRRADVGIDGDRVAVVGELPDPDGGSSGVPSIDVTGLAVSPGFVNILSHGWPTLQLDGRGLSELAQGVTTEVFGEAVSPGPGSAAFSELFAELDPSTEVGYPRLADGLDDLTRRGVTMNVASFLGGHNLRALGAGLEQRPLTGAELDRLRGVVDEELADGALGIGTALIYAPGNYASTDELVALCEVVGRHDGLYISHLRSEGDQLLECLDELLSIGRHASCRAEVFHLKAAGAANHHKMALAISRLRDARAAGQPVGANMYPYTAGATALAFSIPPAFHAGGPAALAARLADPAVRREIAAALAAPSDAFENLFLGAGYGAGVVLLEDLPADAVLPGGSAYRPADAALPGGSAARPAHAALTGGSAPSRPRDLPSLVSRSVVEAASLLGIADPAEALLAIVAAHPAMPAAYFMMSEENVELGLGQDFVSVGSDAATGSGDASDGPTHPRQYGTFARVLGHYSRDRGLFPLAEAIRRMTSLPADTLRLRDRGRLAVGAFADIAVFDPATVADRATYADSHRLAVGMRHVIVNGEPVFADGAVLPARPGRRLRRGTSA